MSSELNRIHRALARAGGSDASHAGDSGCQLGSEDGPELTEKGEGRTGEAGTALEPFGPNWIIAENQPCQTSIPGVTPKETYIYTWSGDCLDGKVSGEGRGAWHVPDVGEFIYEGTMRNGIQHGRGIFTWASGKRYEGEWRDGKPHGRGIYTLAEGGRYEGEWRNGCFSRDGKRATIGTTFEACGFE